MVRFFLFGEKTKYRGIFMKNRRIFKREYFKRTAVCKTVVMLLFGLLVLSVTSCDVIMGLFGEEEKEDIVTLSSIYITKNPAKLEYEVGEKLDLSGLEVKAVFSNKDEQIIKDWKSSPANGSILSNAGKQIITISYNDKSTTITVTVKDKELPPASKADQFFWGTWVRMDSGKQYEILENTVEQNNKSYIITSSDSKTLTVETLGTFKKESDSVIVCNNIPYFRKGGANLEYSLKLVGFANTSRAAGVAMSGIKGKGKSDKYKNFESDGESDSSGTIRFTAPTANDTQTVEITNGNDLVVIPGLSISNSGDYMGTVALVGKDDYNLKITGTISDDQKDNGYLFGNNAKTYNMKLTITNISENKCSASKCIIAADDAKLLLNSTSEDLSGISISTLPGGATKEVYLSLVYGELSKPYVDTGITVTIQNPFTGQEWKDYIPLRFFKGTIPITIAAKNPENNTNAALNGFVIYPDGNNQFFAIPNNSCKVVFVPTFGTEKPYTLVFSGATVTSQLGESTEMFYTVEPVSMQLRTVITKGSEIDKYMIFGGDNHSETTAYPVTEGFEAYLLEGEIDYYTIKADSNDFYGPGGTTFYSVSYVNEKGDAPDTFLTTKGAVLSTIQLPEITCDGYKFLGWYIGDKKIVSDDYTVSGNITLTAKWIKNCTVSYVSAYSKAPAAIIVSEGEKLTAEQLPELTSSSSYFGGWYDGETHVTAGSYTVTADVTLTAKWSDKCTVSYVTEHGTAPESFAVESGSTFTDEKLPVLKATGWKFLGWYTISSCDNDKKASVGQSITTSLTLYAKWEEYTGPDDGFVFVEGGTVVGSDDYNHEYTGVFPAGRTVTLSSFYISDHEVTQGEYETYCCYRSASPSSNGAGADYPVYYVSWYDTIVFCNLKSMAEGLTPCYSLSGEIDPKKWTGIKTSNGKYCCSYTDSNSSWDSITCNMKANGYRLPTEAEWEYAARGGQKTYGTEAFANFFAGASTTDYTSTTNSDLNPVAWYKSNNDGKTHKVKTKASNVLEIYDMSGNILEWCWDWKGTIETENVINPTGALSDSRRQLRGGCWTSEANDCSVARRWNWTPYSLDNETGFRLARTDPSTIHTVTYVSEYGTTPTEAVIRSYITASQLPQLSQNGCIFQGWYNGTTLVTEGYEVTSNITLTAKWELIPYIITYYANGGKRNPQNPESYTVADEIILKDPTYEGRTFAGWFLDSDFTEKITKIPLGSTGDITLYARWGEAGEINVTLPEYNDIQMTYERSGNQITFTGPEGFTGYEWQVDGSRVQTSTNKLTVDVSHWSSGKHTVILTANRTDGKRTATVYVNLE